MAEEIVIPPVLTIKEKSTSIAFEVVYKEPEAEPPSPPKTEGAPSRESLEQKLKEAAERREAERKKIEEKLAKERQREKDILKKVAQEEEKLRQEAAEKLTQKMQEAAEKREAIMREAAEKLKEHAQKVEEKNKLVKENREKGLTGDCRQGAEPSTMTPKQPTGTC